MFLDLISSVMRGFNSMAQDKIEIDESGSGDYDGSGSGSGSGSEDFFDYEQGSTAQDSEEEEGA